MFLDCYYIALVLQLNVRSKKRSPSSYGCISEKSFCHSISQYLARRQGQVLPVALSEDKFEILWMEELLHQLKMVVYPIIFIGF